MKFIHLTGVKEIDDNKHLFNNNEWEDILAAQKFTKYEHFVEYAENQIKSKKPVNPNQEVFQEKPKSKKKNEKNKK